MRNEKSYGAVVFTETGEKIKYVLIESISGVYGFPKGHIEGGESELDTALREVLEETGLVVETIDGFRREISYTFNMGDEVINKSVVYYLAEYSDQTPVAQESELNSISLMDLESALSVLEFEDLKAILKDAHLYLKTRYK